MKSHTLLDTDQTHQLGQAWGQQLPPGTVLLLAGDLGSGKTTFVQGIGAGLGIADAIASPTFTLINEYGEGRVPLYHIDLYRLDAADIDHLNLDLYWDGIEVDPGIVAIEWSEKLTYRPAEHLYVQLQPQGEGRLLTATAAGDRHQQILDRLSARVD